MRITKKQLERMISEAIKGEVQKKSGLKEARRRPTREDLLRLGAPEWKGFLETDLDDLVYDFQGFNKTFNPDAGIMVTLEFVGDLLENGKTNVHVFYSEGYDYEGNFGVEEYDVEVRSISDIKKVLDDAKKRFYDPEELKLRDPDNGELKNEAFDTSIPGGVEFPSVEHIYKRFFVPTPKNPVQLRGNIMQALKAAQRLGAKEGK